MPSIALSNSLPSVSPVQALGSVPGRLSLKNIFNSVNVFGVQNELSLYAGASVERPASGWFRGPCCAEASLGEMGEGDDEVPSEGTMERMVMYRSRRKCEASSQDVSMC